MKYWGIITCRSGSKRLKNKNIKMFINKPLIEHTYINTQNTLLDKIMLSTNCDISINIANNYNHIEVPFKRPSYLATDNASSVDVLNHAIEYCPGYDFVILLQPTSPLRTAEDIDAAFELMISLNAKSCVSVCTTLKTPYWMYSLGEDGVLKKLLQTPKDIVNRQNAPETFELNGAIYIIDINYFNNYLLNSNT